MEVVRAQFRPEFLNRLDEAIRVPPAGAGDMGPNVDIQFARLQAARRPEDPGSISLMRARVAGRVGYEPVHGARPLKRAVQKYLQDPCGQDTVRRDLQTYQRSRLTRVTGQLASTPVQEAAERRRESGLQALPPRSPRCAEIGDRRSAATLPPSRAP